MNRKDFAIIAALIVLAIFARTYRISEESIWFDESIAARNYSDDQSLREYLAQVSATDPTHDPLYFALFHSWTRLAGHSDAASRSLSVALGVAAIVFVYMAGLVYFEKRREATTAALIACMSLSYIYYSQEVRMYSLFLFLASISIYGLIDYFKRGGRASFAITIVANSLLIWTHLFAPFLVIAEAVAMVVHCRKQWRTLFTWLAPQGANAILWWAVWGRHLRFVGVTTATNWIYGLEWDFSAFCRGAADTLSYSSLYPLAHAVAIIVVGFALAGVAWMVRSWRTARWVPSHDLLVLLIALTPILLFAISKWVRPVWVSRYTLYALIATCLLSVLGTRWIPRFQRPLLVLLVLPLVIQFWVVQRPFRADWNAVMKIVNDGRPIVMVPPYERTTIKGQVAGPIAGYSPATPKQWQCDRLGTESADAIGIEFEAALKKSGGWLVVGDQSLAESARAELRKQGHVVNAFQEIAHPIRPVTIWQVKPVRVNLRKGPLVGFVRPSFAR